VTRNRSEAINDADRIAELVKLASGGLTGGTESYFNRLIYVYSTTRRLTDRERQRIDQFLAKHQA
jgi:tRNA A37 N6-isopentenylltransferase MiaA